MIFSINWNYIQAKRQADRLEEQADRLRRLARNQMEEAVHSLSNGWKGDNAGNYLRKATRVKQEMESASAELMRTAEVIRSLAERTYRAEMRVKELARIREY